jgi:hypothetical protein
VEIADVLADAFERIRATLTRTLDGLSEAQLARRVDPGANSIAWLAWHLSRVQDDHMCDAAGIEQVWTREGWVDRFDLGLPVHDIGYGHSSDEVASVGAPADLLLGYHDAVCTQSLSFVSGLTAADLDAVIDESWDPPVTLGVRIVSVLSDDLQHVGQAALLRGLR